jgi:hypothetical protein
VPPITPTQRLATLALGQDVTAWVVERRSSDPSPSFRTIATELRVRTSGQVDVTDETIRLWYEAATDATEAVG